MYDHVDNVICQKLKKCIAKGEIIFIAQDFKTLLVE